MAESEDGYRRCRVAADARKGQQGLVGGRDFPGVVAGDDRGGFVEAEGAAGIAQAAPLADRLARGVGGQRGRGRPPGQPGPVGGQDTAHRGLLQHDLADQHRPRARVRRPPRQVAGVRRIPGENRLGVRRRHEEHYPRRGNRTARIAGCILFACDGTRIVVQAGRRTRAPTGGAGSSSSAAASRCWRCSHGSSPARGRRLSTPAADGSSMAALQAGETLPSAAYGSPAAVPSLTTPAEIPPTTAPPVTPSATAVQRQAETVGQRLRDGRRTELRARRHRAHPGHEPGQLRADSAA